MTQSESPKSMYIMSIDYSRLYYKLLNKLKPGHLIVSHLNSIGIKYYIVVCTYPYREYSYMLNKHLSVIYCDCISKITGGGPPDPDKANLRLLTLREFCSIGTWYNEHGKIIYSHI